MNRTYNNLHSQQRKPVHLMSKLSNCQIKESKLKSRESVETDEEISMQKCLSFTSQNFSNAKHQCIMNPEESKSSIGLLQLDLKGKLTDNKWKPICHRSKGQRQAITHNNSKRKDHFLTVVSRLPIIKHEQRMSAQANV